MKNIFSVYNKLPTVIRALITLVISTTILFVFNSIDSGFTSWSSLSTHDIAVKFLEIVAITMLTYTVIRFVKNQERNRKSIYDAIPLSIITYDSDGKVTYANRHAQELFGYVVESAIGKSVIEFIAKKDRQRAIINLKDNAKKKHMDRWQNNYFVVDAQDREVEATLHFSLFGKNETIATVTDHVEINEMERSYTIQIDFFWSLLNDIPTPLAYCDTDYNHRFINKSYQRVFNKGDDDILGKDLGFILDGEKLLRLNKRIQYVLDSRKNISFEELMVIEGISKVFSVDIVPRIMGGDISGVFISLKDITSEKIKSIALKKEVLLNKNLNKIADILSKAKNKNIYPSVVECLNLIREMYGLGRCYILSKTDTDEIKIHYESIANGLKPYEGFTISTSTKEKELYKDILAKKDSIIIPRFSTSQFNFVKHLTAFHSKSVVEVSMPNVGEVSGYILGVVSDSKYIHWKENDVEFLHSAIHIISTTISRIEQIKELKLSEETLNALINNTDIGIIITSQKNKVFYSNKRFLDLFGIDPTGDNDFKIERYAQEQSVDTIRKAFKAREYSGTATGTFQMKYNGGRNFIAKIFSTKIDYEGDKAYLTTIVDVNEYVNKDVDGIIN